jgi:hypothetical protein
VIAREHRFDWIGRLLLDISPNLVVAGAQPTSESNLVLPDFSAGSEYSVHESRSRK